MIENKPIYTLLLLTLLTLVVVSVVLVLMAWRIPTKVQVDLTVSRVVFTMGETDSVPILHAVPFQSITVEKFARIEFSPEKLEVANPAQQTAGRYREATWTPLTVTPPVVITGENEILQPVVTLESVKGANTVWSLDQTWVRPGSEVSLEVRGTQPIALTLTVDRQESAVVLSLHEPFQLLTDYSRVSGITDSPYQADSLIYRTQLPNHNPFVEVRGQPHVLVLTLTMSLEKITHLLSQGGILATALDFTRQNASGAPETALVKDGEITYPDYPPMGNVLVKASDFIGLDRLKQFRIEEMALDPKDKGIRLRLNGIAGHVRTGSLGFPTDHRLTRFDTLWQNRPLRILVSIIVGVFSVTVAGYRLYKEVKG
jgi:hypothetical protein